MRAVRIPWRVAQDLLSELRLVWPDETLRQRMLMDELARAMKPRKGAAPAKARRAAKAKTRKEKVAELRAQVMGRAQGCCENCGREGEPLQLDHFHGGSNRRAMESYEGCWAVCRHCHGDKTLNYPTRNAWLSRFLDHSIDKGLNSEPQRKARAELASLRLQGLAGEAP